jgi:exo-beta-1,3-glucanase (GH17 family)
VTTLQPTPILSSTVVSIQRALVLGSHNKLPTLPTPAVECKFLSQVPSKSDRQQLILTLETGWPTAGDSNGAANPSPADQATAVGSILSTMTNQVILLSAFNDLWKAPGYLNVEQYWVPLPTSSD